MNGFLSTHLVTFLSQIEGEIFFPPKFVIKTPVNFAVQTHAWTNMYVGAFLVNKFYFLKSLIIEFCPKIKYFGPIPVQNNILKQK